MRIGIDLGGTKIEAVCLDSQGRILDRQRVATPQQDYAATLASIVGLVRQMEQRFACEVAAVGIATPGSISNVSGLMRNCNSTCLNGKPLPDDLMKALGKTVYVANDADCFALSEAVDGVAQTYDTVFGVILGTGVGAGICIKQRLLSGKNGIAGEWGHNPMPPLEGDWAQYSNDGRACYCGRNDCVESYLSGPALEKSYLTATGIQRSAVEIVALADSEDAEAGFQLALYQERLARALATVINILDPDAVVLGGGLSNIESLYQEVPARWGKYIFSDQCETLLLRAEYGDSSGVRGAVWLVP